MQFVVLTLLVNFHFCCKHSFLTKCKSKFASAFSHFLLTWWDCIQQQQMFCALQYEVNILWQSGFHPKVKPTTWNDLSAHNAGWNNVDDITGMLIEKDKYANFTSCIELHLIQKTFVRPKKSFRFVEASIKAAKPP